MSSQAPADRAAPPRSPSASGVTLRLLEIYVHVVESGSMSAAAERLDFTQPAVSHAVTSLERALGAKLLDRSVRPPMPTLQGKAVYDHARDIVSKVHELESMVRYGATGQMPFLRIGILNSFAATAGPHMITLLRDITSDWTVVSGFQATQFQALVDRQVDFIITADETPPPPDIVTYPILTEPFLLALPRNYPTEVKNAATLALSLDFIRYGHQAHMSQWLDQYLEEAGVRQNRRYQFDTTDAAMRMVAGGFGWTVVSPLIFLKSAGMAATVRVQALPGPAMYRQLVVATHRGEGEEIARKIAAAAIQALGDVILPEVAALMPEVLTKVVVPRSPPPAP